MSVAYIVCPQSFPATGADPLQGFVRIEDIDQQQLERFIASQCVAPDKKFERIAHQKGWFVFERTAVILTPSGARQRAAELACILKDAFPSIEYVSIH